MRKVFIPTALVMLLVGMLGSPAMAGKPAATEVIPLDYEFPSWNPCTDAETTTHITGYLQLTEDGGHMAFKWVAAVEDADGYSMPSRHYARQVINVKEDGDSFHLVINETDNVMLTNPDGGKYRVGYRFHVTVDDDVERSFVESFDTVCIKQPK